MNKDYDTNNAFLVARLQHLLPVEFCNKYGLSPDVYSSNAITIESDYLYNYQEANKKSEQIAEMFFKEHYFRNNNGLEVILDSGIPTIGVFENNDNNQIVKFTRIESFHIIKIKGV